MFLVVVAVATFFSNAFILCETIEPVNVYSAELEGVFAHYDSVLSQSARLGSSVALSVLRLAQWENFLMLTQKRKTTWVDRIGYFFMENDVSGFTDRCYTLTPNEMPRLYEMVSEYAAKLGINMPLLLLVDDYKLCDATAANWDKKSGFIVLGRGIFEEYTTEQFCGMLAYQMGNLATRTYARMTQYFVPGAIGGLIFALWGIAKMSSRDDSVIQNGAMALGILSTYGISLSLYWCWLSRQLQRRSDGIVAKINPSLGLALLAALEQSRSEDAGGDLVTSQQIIKNLQDISDDDRAKALMLLEQARAVGSLSNKILQTMDTGIFGGQLSIDERRAYFEKQVISS